MDIQLGGNFGAASETIYPYVKIRKQFGRQPRFVRDRYRTHCNIQSNRALRKKYSRYRCLHKEVQVSKGWSESPMNTNRRVKVNQGINHTEGGWPKEINPNEPDMMVRHRKKLEKEEHYQVCLPIMFDKLQKFLKQNNALDFYGEMFKKKWKHRDAYRKTPKAKTVLIYEDPSHYQRCVRKIIWAPENVGRMGVCHAPPQFSSALRESPTEAYFWEVEIASRPESQVRSDSHIMDINYHPKDMHTICGACFDGSVQHWDARVGANPMAVTPLTNCHTDVCTAASWVNSKTNTEFFSTGLDGQVIWWDFRNLNERLDTNYLDPEKGQARPEAALAATVLEYEQTLPTKYIAGTENGKVMLMMRKSKTPGDKLINVYHAHTGPILAVQRNPIFIKNFVTAAESTVKIFSEECRESAIMWSAPKDVLYTHASWVPSRPSEFIVTRNDGYFDVYDLLKDPARPYTCIKLRSSMDNKKKPKRQYKGDLMQDTHLTYAAPCDAPSKLLAIGSSKGNVYMQKMSESLYMCQKTDKPILAQCFERESRREKLIEQRYREMRLKKRDKEKMADLAEKMEKERDEAAEKILAEAKAAGITVAPPDFSKNKKYDLAFEARHDPICKVEREFYVELEREIADKGVEAWAEFAEALEAEKKEGGTGNVNIDEVLDITAADLAAFAHVEEEEEFDDDGRPIKKPEESKEKAPIAKASAAPVTPAAQPPPAAVTPAAPSDDVPPAPPPPEPAAPAAPEPPAPAAPEPPAPSEEAPTESEAETSAGETGDESDMLQTSDEEDESDAE